MQIFNYAKKLTFLSFAALVTEFICIYRMRGIRNICVFDLLPMNTIFQGSLVDNLLAWMIPLLAAFICGRQFNLYYPLRNAIFTRERRRTFVLRCALESAIRSFIGIFYYYLCCMIFCIIMAKTADPAIPMTVSMRINQSSVLIQGFYESMPAAYLYLYFLLSSMYGAVFGLVGFLASCLTRNRVAVFFSPYAVMMILSILLAVVPRSFGTLLDYNAFCTLRPGVLTYLPVRTQMAIGFAAPIFWSFILFILIIWLTRKDHVWQ